MDKIKSIKDLQNMRDAVKDRMNIGKKGEYVGDKILIKVGMATCGIASGARETKDAFIEELKNNQIPKAEVIQTGCIGYCHSEPIVEVLIPGRESVIFGNVEKEKVKEIVENYIKKGERISEVAEDGKFDYHRNGVRIALRNCGFIDPDSIDEYIARDGYQGLGRALADITPLNVVEEIKKSGLRGRGGGGFPTGLKWELAYKNESNQKYVVCNADEGDPGAFMDRSIMEGDPHSVLEGMAICGRAIGADKGRIYIRAEYPLAIKRLQKAIDDANECGLLGENIMGKEFNFDIKLSFGAGAFVCGEETALIHSMEGERGEPNTKPPFPVHSGYWTKPTVVNNVETFANVPAILIRGVDWFTSIGTEKSKGTKVFALAGKVNNVGLIEVPMGTTLKEVIFNIGGGIKDEKKFKAVQTGGPSGGCLTEKDLDTPIDFDSLLEKNSMMGSGGMIIMDEDDCMPAMAQFYIEFSEEESCGKCTPCRIGTRRLSELLKMITTGKANMRHLDELRRLCRVMKDTSLCGLGQTSPNPILSTLEAFGDEYIAHIRDKKCPAGRCNIRRPKEKANNPLK